MNLTFYDRYTGVIHYYMIHTLNRLGNPDTLSLDPMVTYDIGLQTIPPIRIDSVRLVAGRHNTIEVDAAQGYLYIRTRRGNAYDNEQVLVKRAGEQELVNIQEMGTLDKYLVGSYDLLIPIFPVMEIHGVEIAQRNTTTVEIPAPGYVTFSGQHPGSGALYQLNEDGNQLWVLNLKSHVNKQSYHLQPGTYRVVFRRNDLKATDFTVVKDFSIDPGDTETVAF